MTLKTILLGVIVLLIIIFILLSGLLQELIGSLGSFAEGFK